MAKLASIVVLMGVIAADANAGKAEATMKIPTVELDSCNPAANPMEPGCCCMMGNCQRIDPLTQRCCQVRRGMAVCAKEQECGGESWGTDAYCVNVATTPVVANAATTTTTTSAELHDGCNPVANPLEPGCCCMMGNCQRIDPLTQRCCQVRRGMAVCAKEQECGGESWGIDAYCVNVTTTTVVTTTTGMEAISISSSTTLLHSGEQTSWTTSATTTLTSVQSMTETSGTRLDFDEAITSTASGWTTSGHAVVLCMLVLLSALTQ